MFVAVSLGAAAALSPAAAAAADPWRPDVRAARAYALERPGSVAFSVRVGDRVYGHRSYVRVPAASLMKTMLLAAYLRRGGVRNRPLTSGQRKLLSPMIRRSDNAAASRVLGIVGVVGELAVARRIGMRDFMPFTVWGLSRTSARDQSLLFWRLRRVIPPRHRRFAFGLLRTVVARQRWGLARAVPRGWRLYFKGGWGSGTGAVDHQAALLLRGERRVALAITTTGNRSHEAGAATLRGVAARLLRGLA